MIYGIISGITGAEIALYDHDSTDATIGATTIAGLLLALVMLPGRAGARHAILALPEPESQAAYP
jgi:hypothetical protein